MDFITGLPELFDGRRFVNSILVIVDRFTKYALFFPVSSTMTTADLAHLIHKEVELKYGTPRGIVSDRGSLFTSKFWSDLCFHTKVKRRLSTAFHPQTDGQTEAVNQILERYLRCFVDEQQANWHTLLVQAEYACNNSRNTTTGMSPFLAMLGYHPELSLDNDQEPYSGEIIGVRERLRKLEALREQLKEHWRLAVESRTKQYDKNHVEMEFKVGQLVMLSTKNFHFKATLGKLAPRYIGPFRITAKIGRLAYRIILPDKYSKMHNVFNITRLEPWTSNKGSDPLPMPDLEDSDPEWELEEIVEEKEIQKEIHFLVKWKDWPAEYNSWVPEEDLLSAKQAVNKFRKAQEKTKKRVTKAQGKK